MKGDLVGLICRWVSVPCLLLFFCAAVYRVSSACTSSRRARRTSRPEMAPLPQPAASQLELTDGKA